MKQMVQEKDASNQFGKKSKTHIDSHIYHLIGSNGKKQVICRASISGKALRPLIK
jgi:hypothetical protein